MKKIIITILILIPQLFISQILLTQLGSDIDGEAPYDYSGVAVSMNSAGDRVAIGAPGNGGNASTAGHVRIYSHNGSNWNQLGSDIDGDVSGDYSGHSVSMNSAGDRVAIGASLKDVNGIYTGQVRIYSYNGSSWVQLGSDIDGEAPYDNSGVAVSMNSAGDRVAIGAINNDGNGDRAGHVRIYSYNGSSWTQLGGDIDGEAAYDESGGSVSMNSAGDRVAIGAFKNDGNGYNSGHIRIYNFDGSSWIQLGQDIDGEAANDGSGCSVSMNSTGNRVAIAAYNNDGNGNDAGHVRIYSYNGSSWTQLGGDIDGEGAYDETWSVSMNSAGDRVSIGAPRNAGNGTLSGHVRIYSWNGGSWVQLGVDIDGESSGDNSGRKVSMNAAGDRVAIGAPANDGNGSNSGHVRIYSICQTTYGDDLKNECNSYTWIDANTYTTSNNTATHTLTNAAGCDSVVTLNLTINNSTTGTDTITACKIYTWIDEVTYTSSNYSATYTLTNHVGCDSVVTLNLTINNNSTGTDIQTACDSYTWIDGVNYTASN